MPLSEDERRELADIERYFAAEDPRLARKLRAGRTESLGMNVLFAGLIFVSAVAGLLLISAGVAQHAALLIILGAAATTAGAATAVVWFQTRHGTEPRE